jgi:hypothetical protein
LQPPLRSNLKNVWWLIQAIGQLHIFCIDQHLKENGDEPSKVTEERASILYLPSQPLDEKGDPIESGAFGVRECFRGYRQLRQAMAERVKTFGLTHPSASKKRIIESQEQT